MKRAKIDRFLETKVEWKKKKYFHFSNHSFSLFQFISAREDTPNERNSIPR